MAQHTSSRGQIIIELLVAFGLAVILLPALLTGLIAARNGKVGQEQRILAVGLLREGEEAVRSVRDVGWDKIATNGTYYPKVVGSGWTLTTDIAYKVVGDFKRIIEIADTSPADPSLKKIIITVSWGDVLPSDTTSVLYLTRWKNTFTTLTTTGQLTGLGHGDWCNPNLNITPYDISGNGIGIAVSSVPGASPGSPDGAFISTGNNASSNSLYSLNITDPAYPATPLATTANTYNNGKDYGIFTNSNYVYVAAGSVPSAPKRLVDILNVSNLSRVGFFDGASKMTATSVYVSGTTGYVTADTDLLAFTASPVNGSSSQSQLWIKALNGSAIGNKVVVSGGYAYIATSATTNSRQLQVVQLSDQTIYSPPASSTGSINTNQPGADIAVLGNYAYLVTNYSSSSTPDIFIIDISTPTSPKVVGTANTFYSNASMAPLGVATTPNNANILIVVGDGGWQYQTFNVNDPTNPARCGAPLQNPNEATKIQAVSTLREVDGDVYSYVLTTSGSEQRFQIMEGGPGGAGGNGGVFESQSFDAGHSVVFNNLTVTDLQPPGITATYQVAVSQDCTTFSYTGNYDSNGGAMPLSINPGRCFRYKVTFTGGGGATSASTTVSVNYSP